MINRSTLTAVAVLALTGMALPAFAQAPRSGSATPTSAPAVSGTKQAVPPTAHKINSSNIRLYDGAWSVVIETTSGFCPAAIRAGVRIFRGQVLADDPSYQLNGRITPSGLVQVTVAASGQSAGGYGRLSRRVGRGLWRTSAGECSGQWIAERRS